MAKGRYMSVVTGTALAVALAGCRNENTDTDVAIAKIGNEKVIERVTEAQFKDLVTALFGDSESAMDFLNDEKNRGQRNEFLAKYIEGKGLIMLAKEEGVDDDPKVRLQLDGALIDVYAQALIERRLSKAEPTDAQLREVYFEIAAQQRALGNGMPPFEEARPHLPPLWKQRQQQIVAESLMKEIKDKFPITIANEYKAATG